ncbi:precorrin-4 C(11)-methyltransferase [Clostridiaceae bacterium M8S5]|nr:precorrin-4 C(11)-methyltransferase [Clostridiaceae bacterium M8S5]
MNKVYYVGAGPGDPELLTIKAKRLIDNADIIIFAGSLVNPEVYSDKKEDAKVYNSASMTLEEVMDVTISGVIQGKKVVRVHTGDPSIYGAIKEQMDILEKEDIEYEVVPGVSSFTAAAATIKKEFTLPNVSQTIICTRLKGRTSVPEKENLEKLAKHRASMAIFLSVQMIEEVVDSLIKHYDKSAPIAVVQRATWHDERVVIGTLENIAKKVKEANITKTAQILVGDFINSEYELSKLYDKSFAHEYRGSR